MKQTIRLTENELKRIIRESVMEQLGADVEDWHEQETEFAPEAEDPTQQLSDIIEECGYGITDSYDAEDGIVYVIEPDTMNPSCDEEEVRQIISDNFGGNVKFGRRTSPQAPEMNKLLVKITW